MRIIVEGHCGEGKTTVAQEIYRHLGTMGFNVELSDFEFAEYAFHRSPEPQEFHDKCIEAVKAKGTEIRIVSVQVRRDAPKLSPLVGDKP